MSILTANNAKDFIGKTVKWGASSYTSNAPYGGTARFINVLEDGKISAETLEGDDIAFAFLDKTNQGTLLDENYCYSDAGRYISITEEVNEKEVRKVCAEKEIEQVKEFCTEKVDSFYAYFDDDFVLNSLNSFGFETKKEMVNLFFDVAFYRSKNKGADYVIQTFEGNDKLYSIYMLLKDKGNTYFPTLSENAINYLSNKGND